MPQVFRPRPVPSSWRQKLMAACLAAGDGAVASHRAAAALWIMDGFELVPVEISVTRKVRVTLGVVGHQVNTLEPHEICPVDGIPCTTPARTLIDLGAVAGERRVEAALEGCLRRKLTTVDQLLDALERHGASGRNGVGTLRRIIESRYGKAASMLEVDLGRLIRKARLPAPVPQFEIMDVAGRFVARPDFVYPDAKLVIEAQSYRWHSSRAAWEADVKRVQALHDLGWTVLLVTWADVHKRPSQTVARIHRRILSNKRVLYDP